MSFSAIEGTGSSDGATTSRGVGGQWENRSFWATRRQLLVRLIITYTAAIAGVISGATIILWFITPAWVDENVPMLYQCKFNTALGLLAGSGALLALGQERNRAARAAALFIIALASLIMGQHLLGIDLGIDQLFASDDSLPVSPHPGRTSVTSCTAFLLLGGALLFASLAKTKLRYTVSILMLFCLLAICLAALGGYFSQVPLVYTWGTFARMSPQTALAFLALAIGLAAQAWTVDSSAEERDMPYWQPVLYAFVIFWFDLSTPLGVVAGIAYVPLIFFSLGYRRAGMPFALAAVATVLTVLGYFWSPGSANVPWIPPLNRFMSICAVWFTAGAVHFGRQESTAREETERYLNSVVNTVLDGLITMDARGRIQRFNPAAERIFGYTFNEVAGLNIKMLMPEPYHGQHDGYLGNYFTTGVKQIIGSSREVAAKRKDGTVFPIELSVGEMTISGKRMFVGTIRDISRRKNAEYEIEQYVAALQRSNQDLDDFAYIASHDLKEPLRGLSNNARFLQEDFDGTLGAAGDKRIARMLYLCNRMEQLVDDLLYFSRLGRQEQAVQPTDLNTVVADIEKMLETTLEEANARIVVPRKLPTITADLPRITEAFRNLITNAVKYNDSPEKLVEIGWRQEGGERVFYVRDNGFGIPSEFHEEVFRIFRRLNAEDDKVKGTGVGLTFVRKIVERHNGHIWVESALGEGATFHFTLNSPNLH